MSNCTSCPSKGSCGKKEESCGVINNPLNKIDKVIAVMSGKGGVGKSTMTTLMAKELAKKGFKVGILDGDITGPSIPRLMGLGKEKVRGTAETFYPVVSEDGIKVISLNMLVEDENQPVVWRGPILGNVIKQFWKDTIWGELDYLLIDMPPGTGDVALTIFGELPINGVVMISVPQDMISMIVAKAVNMARKMNVEVYGVIQNMAYVLCPGCETKINFHEENESAQFMADMNLEVLGELPMMINVSSLATKGYDATTEKLIAPMVERILDKVNKVTKL